MCLHYENTLVKHIREAIAYFFVNVVVRRVVINVRLLSFRYLMIINAQCTYFVPFGMNCFCEWVCVCAVRVSLILRCNIPSFTAHQYHNQLQSMWMSVFAFFGAVLVSTLKFLRVFHTSQQHLASFQALKRHKREKLRRIGEKKIRKTNTEESCRKKHPFFQTFWDFRQYI